MRSPFSAVLRLLVLLPALAAAGCTGLRSDSGPTPVELSGMEAVGAGIAVPVTSMRARRFLTTVRQRTDYSCGSAAIATLLTHHYLMPTAEAEVFRAMVENGDRARIEREGFSFLDMQRYLASRGLNANGFRAPLERLAALRVPAVVLVDIQGYRHFVVLRGIEATRVLLADSNLGTRTMRRDVFERAWNGIAFVVLDRPEFAQATYGAADDWAVRARAPVEWLSTSDGWRGGGQDVFNTRFF